MDLNLKIKQKKREYKKKFLEAQRLLQDTQYELKLLRDERDKAIGEKCLATAKMKEQFEDLSSLQFRYQHLETSYISMKIDHVNLKSNYESLKDDYEISKKMLAMRDKEIQGLSKIQDSKRKAQPDTPTRLKEPQRPPINKNIRPFPSASFSFNLISSKQSSFNGSFKEE